MNSRAMTALARRVTGWEMGSGDPGTDTETGSGVSLRTAETPSRVSGTDTGLDSEVPSLSSGTNTGLDLGVLSRAAEMPSRAARIAWSQHWTVLRGWSRHWTVLR